jgi:hypothetical protein
VAAEVRAVAEVVAEEAVVEDAVGRVVRRNASAPRPLFPRLRAALQY